MGNLIRLFIYLPTKIEEGVRMAPSRRKPELSSEVPLDPYRDLFFHLHGKAGLMLFRMLPYQTLRVRQAVPVFKDFFSGVMFPIDPYPKTSVASARSSGFGFAPGFRAPSGAWAAPPGLKYPAVIPAGL